jgi:hypothetical protein
VRETTQYDSLKHLYLSGTLDNETDTQPRRVKTPNRGKSFPTYVDVMLKDVFVIFFSRRDQHARQDNQSRRRRTIRRGSHAYRERCVTPHSALEPPGDGAQQSGVGVNNYPPTSARCLGTGGPRRDGVPGVLSVFLGVRVRIRESSFCKHDDTDMGGCLDS